MTQPAKALAGQLVGAVHDNDKEACHAILNGASRGTLMAVAVVLASSVRQDDPLMAHYKPPMVPFDDIVDAACEVTGCTEQEFYAETRHTVGVTARHIAVWVGSAAGYSLKSMGRMIHRDHSTVHASVDKVTRDDTLYELATRVVKIVGADRIDLAAQGARR